MSSRDRHFERLLVSPGAIVSVQEAAELLPLHDGTARRWLADRGLVRQIEGRSVVVWADVL